MRFPYLCVTILVSVNAFAALPIGYDESPRQTKSEILWDNITADPYPAGELPNAETSTWDLLNLLNPYYLMVTFSHVGDEMPAERKRVIHSYGTAARVRWEPQPNSFSGVFTTGGIGIVRLSLAKAFNDPVLEVFNPGISVKLLIDGAPSVNFVAINNLDGQEQDQNFFARSLTNVLEEPSLRLQVLSVGFKVAAYLLSLVNERTLPLENAARVQSDGIALSKADARAPFQIFFEPIAASAALYANDGSDFRLQLARLPIGTPIYRVFAKRENAERELVGVLVLESNFVASRYVDETIFFQH